jgi:hypothetical protein|tara:strand:+ start:501 stop:767 length:267 start_codon:yes stop_codon:yes gene_type:complete
MKTANEMLNIADKLVSGDRAQEYGDKKTMHDNIARLWSAYLNTDVTGHDVALMMTLLKMARTKAGNVTEDTYVDMAAYSAIAGELKNI